MEEYKSSGTYSGGAQNAKPAKTGGFGKYIVIAVIAIIALGLIRACFVVTYRNEYTLVRQFGKIDHVVSEPGLSMKIPFIQTADTLPKTILIYDLEPSDVITMDKKTMVADLYVLWRINNPTLFVQTLNSQLSNAEVRINAAVFNSMKNVISSLNQMDVISGRDGALSSQIRSNIGTGMEQYGIELISVVVKRLDLPDDNKSAVYDRMISERNNIAAKYTAEGEAEAQMIRTQTDYEITISVSEAEAKAAETVAAGEAEYMRKLSSAYNDPEKADFYTFVLSLDAAKKSLIGGKKTLILSSDSPIAQIFMNAE